MQFSCSAVLYSAMWCVILSATVPVSVLWLSQPPICSASRGNYAALETCTGKKGGGQSKGKKELNICSKVKHNKFYWTLQVISVILDNFGGGIEWQSLQCSG